MLFAQDYHTLRAFPTEQGNEPHWTVDTGRGGGVVRHEGRVYIGGEPKVQALDEKTGAVQWTTPYKEVTSFQVVGMARETLLAHSEGHVETHRRYLRAYDPRDGRELWKLESNQVAVRGDKLFAGESHAGIPPFTRPKIVVRCLNPRDGSTRWKITHKGTDPFRWQAGPDGTVYAVTDQVEAHRDGKKIWSQPLDKAFDLGPVATEKELIFASGQGTVLALDPQTGETRWRQDGLGEMLVPPTVGPDGTLYVKNRDGSVKALRPFDAKRDIERMAPSAVEISDTKVVLPGVRLNVRDAART
jgi:outer membrane protein assembly factor BamB